MIPTSDSVGYTRRPTVVLSLIGACIIVFIYQLGISGVEEQTFLQKFALIPRRYFSPEWAAQHGLSPINPLPLVTNTFLHGGFFHILSNLWVLWVFGPPLEQRLGSGRFLALYLTAGLAASLLHTIFNASSAVPALGASGAIAGIIAAYARRFPYAWVNVLQPIFIFPLFFTLPVLMFAFLWFLLQVMQAAGSLMMPAAGGVAWFAHVGGFLAGWLLLKPIAPDDPAAHDYPTRADSVLWPWGVWWRWWTWWWPKR